MQTTKKIKPYYSNELNNVEIAATLCTTFTMILGIFYLQPSTDEKEQRRLVILFVILLLVNINFLFYWAWHMGPVIRKLALGFLSKFRENKTSSPMKHMI